MEKETFICCICNKLITNEWSNNPAGAAWHDENGVVEFGKFSEKDRCCNDCNSKYVIPGRLYASILQRGKKNDN